MSIPLDLLTCSRRMIFEYENESEFPYFSHGTFFLCRWHQRYFAVTANHVLRDHPVEIVRLWSSDEDRDFLPIDLNASPVSTNEEYEDFGIFRIAESAPSGRWQRDAVEISMRTVVRGRSAYRPGGTLVVSGYPHVRQNIDYETRTFASQRVILPARYMNAVPGKEHVHSMEFIDRAGIDDLDGFSGSPIFAEMVEGWGFAGIAIKGKASWDMMHFIDSAVLYRALEKLDPTDQ